MANKRVPEKFISWMIDREMKTSSGIPFEWDEHFFALQPMSDMHPFQAINKCAQVGFSEMMSCKAIYLAQECGLNVGYTIHNAKAMDDFVKTKFDPITTANPIIGSRIGGNASKKVIQFQPGQERFIHLVGAYNSASSSKQEQSTVGISFTVDILIHDEDSRSDPYVIDQLTSRIFNSDYGYVWKFDNPLYPGRGADKVWQESDQMHFMIKCPRCNKRQYLDWIRLDQHAFVSGTHHVWIDTDRKQIICGRCQKPIDEETRRLGEWVAKYPSKGGQHKDGVYFGLRGYWINQLMYIRHNVQSIFDLEEGPKAKSKSVFANMVLGRPYIGSDIRVDRKTIIESIQARPLDESGNYIYGNICMGVDQGREKQYVIGDEYGIFKVGRTNSWAEIMLIQKQYDAIIVMDANPETGMPKKICEENPGKAWRAVYKPESDQSELARFSPKNDKSLVLVRREEMFDEIANDFNDKKVIINLHPNELHEYIDDWNNLIRITEADSEGNMRFKWDQANGATDFAHATLYFKVAMMKARRGNAQAVEYGQRKAPEQARTPQEIIDSFTRAAK